MVAYATLIRNTVEMRFKVNKQLKWFNEQIYVLYVVRMDLLPSLIEIML